MVSLTLAGIDIVTCHFNGIAEKNFAIGYGRIVPGLALDGLKLRELFELLRVGFHQSQLTGTPKHNQMRIFRLWIDGQQNLSITVAAIFPFALAGVASRHVKISSSKP